LLGLIATLSSCSSSPSQPDAVPASADITVFAASSLTGAFTEIGRGFEAGRAGVHVVFNFGPSDGLATQIATEGTADVFASASPAWMDEVQKEVGVSDRVDFATNRLVVITPPGDPAHVESLSDLADPGVDVILGAAGVPVGDYARRVLDLAGIFSRVMPNVVSDEQDDAAVVAKIASGEADAAIVYSSDLRGATAPRVRAISIPDRTNVVAVYPIAVVNGTSSPALAASFISFVTGRDGRATLERFGFLP
jgi:molybdate transport system substrate-binding protein